MPVAVVRTRAELKKILQQKQSVHGRQGRPARVGFVPTMGALHAGHARLIEASARQDDVTVVSIFVNPKQFGPAEDLSKYPRTLESDVRVCEQAGAQVVFAPSVDEVYPESFRTSVTVSGLSGHLCGALRPGHFDGVCTVVLVLLNLVGAQRAYFGLKDFQQFTILRRMTQDLAHPTQLVPVPTVRDTDGLALSSRNKFLDGTARQTALRIPRALQAVASLYLDGERSHSTLMKAAATHLAAAKNFEPQYCELLDANDLSVLGKFLTADSVLAVAGVVEGADGVRTRLIDNLLLSDDPTCVAELEKIAYQISVDS